MDSLASDHAEEQYAALEGLERYYEMIEEDLDEDLIRKIDFISEHTNNSTVLSTCLQIKINAGLIDEMSADFMMDDWMYDDEEFMDD